MGGAMAAGLTGLMILLFLGNWRLTLITLASIPLSIVTAIIVLYIGGETLNTMTLGGFALAVGILVDNGTVVIENIERHVKLGEELTEAIVTGCGEVGVPTMLSTLSISIVFVPVFLLQGTAKYLFSPMSLSVCVSLIASLVLSFTLVPVLFNYLMRSSVERQTSVFFILLMGCSLPVFTQLGRDFFPQVDAGQMRLHVRAPPGTRIEETQHYFAEVEKAIRQIVGEEQVDVILDNIGLPYSGINIALSDSATVGTMDGEILISLKTKHTPTAAHVANLRRELPKRFPELQFFFEPADIVDQVLNFGLSTPIDIRVSGPNSDEAYALAQKIAGDISHIPGVVDSHVFQVPNAPALTIDVDRSRAQELGISEAEAIGNVLVTTNSSGQTSPNFWVDPKNGVSYLLAVQLPTYRVNSAQDLWTVPVTQAGAKSSEMLMNIAQFGRTKVPIVASQFNIMPVFDVNADVQGRDLASAAAEIEKVMASEQHSPTIKVALSGQVETMLESYNGLFSGMAFAMVLVYLLLVINFQSWIDPLIVVMALPFAIGGVIWMLFLSLAGCCLPHLQP